MRLSDVLLAAAVVFGFLCAATATDKLLPVERGGPWYSPVGIEYAPSGAR